MIKRSIRAHLHVNTSKLRASPLRTALLLQRAVLTLR
jgi:hypothetical protein